MSVIGSLIAALAPTQSEAAYFAVSHILLDLPMAAAAVYGLEDKVVANSLDSYVGAIKILLYFAYFVIIL